jgi:cytochrome oxidase Cu insertion factor (SCO1/SenC/PrrC family)
VTFGATDASAFRPLDLLTTALVDQRNAPFSLHELRGAPVLVTFVATRCRGRMSDRECTLRKPLN